MKQTSDKDCTVVRNLAMQVSEIAHDEPRMSAIRKRWHDVNALRKPDRAPVWCKPVHCWTELIPAETLECVDPEMRRLELELRKILVKREIDDDTPIEPTWSVPAAIDADPPNLWGIERARHHSDESGGAWSYAPVVSSLADLDRLVMPAFVVNRRKTQERAAKLDGIFGDILPVRIVLCPEFGHATKPGQLTAEFVGMTEMMLALLTEPELIHRLAAHFRDAELRRLDAMESSGLLTPNIVDPMECSELFGPPASTGSYTLANLWSSGNSQEFDQVGPEIWEEFCLAYQRPIFARFGRVIYGCCENLTKKIDGVLSIPNLRVFVCSAWSNLDTVLERVGNNYCVMWRQKATDVVCPESLDGMRKQMEESARKMRGFHYQIVLRELETLYGRNRRLHDWTRIAREVAETYAD